MKKILHTALALLLLSAIGFSSGCSRHFKHDQGKHKGHYKK